MDRLSAAAERRYDGPFPLHACLPADAAAAPQQQYRARASWAWEEVRRQALAALHARREFRRSGQGAHKLRWLRIRSTLAHALRLWRHFRTASNDAGFSPGRSDRSRSTPGDP